MNKYIIKNCENLLYCTSCEEYECSLAGDYPYKRKCSDTDNCNLKQIVELCKKEKILYEGDYIKVRQRTLISSDKLLDLLDIQEVE